VVKDAVRNSDPLRSIWEILCPNSYSRQVDS
jgi:hypothetical protein